MFEDKLLLEQHLRQRDNVADGFVELLEFLRQVEHEPLLKGQVEVGLVFCRLILADVVDVVEDGTTDVYFLDPVRELLELEEQKEEFNEIVVVFTLIEISREIGMYSTCLLPERHYRPCV